MLMDRRTFCALPLTSALASASRPARMTIMLACGSIGVKADQRQAIDYAARFGFQSVEADSAFLAGLEPPALESLTAGLKDKGLVWGNTGLPVDFRRDDTTFRTGLAELPRRAAALRRAGITRVSTWISPAHRELTFLENLKQHAARLREIASVLVDNNCRLGLEYVGPKTSWTAQRFPFVHTMKEMKELIAEIGKPNVGFLLDSWHWYTSGETVADLRTLTNSQIVSVDLNDAPAGIPVDQQIDSRRALPCETGVIDLAGFLTTLADLGCDAPVRCEPFSQRLREMPPEEALQATVTAMKKAFSLIA
jgi:sugar phosphate isomerase/epimerase